MDNFQLLQHQFMAHIRDPDKVAPIAGIELRRLAIYRELMFNNVLNFVSSGFPVLKTLFTTQQWQALTREFFINHDCTSPYFIDISKEFLIYLSQERDQRADDLPFLVELAHYEWVELEVSIRKIEHDYPYLAVHALAELPMVMSRSAWPLSYSFPVHQISKDFQPLQAKPGSVHLIVYRDVQDEVQFMQINAVTALLVQLLTDSPGMCWPELLAGLLAALPQFTEQQIEQGALATLDKLAQRGIICQFMPAIA